MSNKLKAEEVAATLAPDSITAPLAHYFGVVFDRQVDPQLIEAIVVKLRHQLTLDILEALNTRDSDAALVLTRLRIDSIKAAIAEVSGE